MQKIDILGMSVTDYSLKEKIGITDRFIGSGTLNTILFISAKILVEAGVSEKQQAWIGAADLIVWSDAEIVRQAGIKEKERFHEVENQDYIKEVLKRLGRAKKAVYLLADSEEELEKLEYGLKSLRDDLNITGRGIAGTTQSEWDGEANRINTLAPTAVISAMPFEQQGELMESMKKILNADLWLALDPETDLGSRKPPILRKLLGKWYRYLFQKLIAQYRHKDEEDTEQNKESEKTKEV